MGTSRAHAVSNNREQLFASLRRAPPRTTAKAHHVARLLGIDFPQPLSRSGYPYACVPVLIEGMIEKGSEKIKKRKNRYLPADTCAAYDRFTPEAGILGGGADVR